VSTKKLPSFLKYFLGYSDFANGVKKVSFDVASLFFFSREPSCLVLPRQNCKQEFIGSAVVPASNAVLVCADIIFFSATKAKIKAMCLVKISLMDKLSQSAIFYAKTKDLQFGSASNTWKYLHHFFLYH
jgi:hypothetical protein